MASRKPDDVAVRLGLRLGGEPFEADVTVPAGPARVSELVPALQPLASRILERAVSAHLDATGREISCRAGCGACCRQPVPIAEAEALHLRRLVDAMPEPRRRRVEARFEAALRRLEEAGLLARVRGLADLERAEDRQALGLDYFRLGIPCPFLEDESCGIHPDRPLACREYLVTSPPERCADPSEEAVEMVPVPVRPSVSLFRLAGGPGGDARPLVLVLAWAAQGGREPTPGTGPELLERFVRGLAGSASADGDGTAGS